MTRYFYFTFFFQYILTSTLAQEIKVVDKNDHLPIENVMIYNLSYSNVVQTNSEGMASLFGFDPGDILVFRHPAYHEVSYPFNSMDIPFIQLEEKIIRINEVVISASRWEQDRDAIPNAIATIHSREIELKNPPTSADLLQESGQIFVQKSQLGGGSPMIRGFSANSVLLVVDGVRMNNAIYRSGNLQNVISIDVNAVQEAEVLFGPGSVMYGSDALGGVMDFHIKNPFLTQTDCTEIRTEGFLRYSSAAREKTGHFDLSIGGKKIGSFTSLSYTSFEDLRTGCHRTSRFPDFGKRTEYVIHQHERDTILQNNQVNIQKFSGYDQYSLIQKFTFRPSDDLDLNYGFYYSNTTNIPRYDRLILYDSDSLPESAEWYYGPQTWLMNRFQIRLYHFNRVFSEARLTFSHQWVAESRNDRNYQREVLRSRMEKLNVYSVNVDFDKSFNDNHQLYYGLDVSYNLIHSDAMARNIKTGETSPISTRYPDGGSTYYFAALYGNYQWLLHSKINVSAGLRYTHTGLKASLEDKIDLGFPFEEFSGTNGSLNGSLGLVYHFSERTKLDAILSSGFRAPNIDDMGKLFDSEPGYVVVPNKNLQPEFTYNGELGITQYIGKNVQIHAVGFYTWLREAMVRRDFRFNGKDSLVYDGELRKVQALVNTGRANIYGFSLVLKGDITLRWGIFSSFTFTDGKDQIDEVPLRHTPPAFGMTSIFYKNKGLLAETNIAYSADKSYEELAPSEQNKLYLYTTEGALAWYTLNFRLKYHFSPVFTANLGIENILDKHYRPYSSGISAPGRNFILAIRVNL